MSPIDLTGAPFAHRGLWRPGACPENSLGAFAAACAAGYGIELDARLTADGEAVVFHDDQLDRMTAESGLVEEWTAETLAGMALLGGEHQHIPGLDDALDLVAGRCGLLIELKTPVGQEGLLEARVAELLEAYDGPAAVLSFNPDALAWMAQHHPAIPRGLNAETVEQLQAADHARADFLSVSLNLAQSPHVWAWRARGRRAIAWTVRQDADRQALNDGVDSYCFEGFLP